MRFQQFVTTVVLPVSERLYQQTCNLSQNVNGGWEVWFQIELYFKLQTLEAGLDSFEREPFYPNRKRADFNFVSRNSQSNTNWVELKTLRNADVDNAISEFLQDIHKVNSSNLRVENNTVGAIVIIPVNSSRFLSALRNQVTQSDQLYRSLKYYTFSNNGVNGAFGLADDPLINGGIVMYYKK